MPQPFVDFAHVKEHASFERVLAHYNLALTGHAAQRAILCPFRTKTVSYFVLTPARIGYDNE